MIKKIYLASPFFNDEEIMNVTKAEKILRDKGLDVWSPREHEVREYDVGTRLWSETIFKMDSENILDSDVVVMLYYGNYSDTGTAWEVGFAFANNKKVIVVHLKEDSNLMVHEGSYTNLKGLEELEKYDFENLLKKAYEGKMF